MLYCTLSGKYYLNSLSLLEFFLNHRFHLYNVDEQFQDLEVKVYYMMMFPEYFYYAKKKVGKIFS